MTGERSMPVSPFRSFQKQPTGTDPGVNGTQWVSTGDWSRRLGQAARAGAVVFYTLVEDATRRAMLDATTRLSVPVVDVLGPALSALFLEMDDLEDTSNGDCIEFFVDFPGRVLRIEFSEKTNILVLATSDREILFVDTVHKQMVDTPLQLSSPCALLKMMEVELVDITVAQKIQL